MQCSTGRGDSTILMGLTGWEMMTVQGLLGAGSMLLLMMRMYDSSQHPHLPHTSSVLQRDGSHALAGQPPPAEEEVDELVYDELAEAEELQDFPLPARGQASRAARKQLTPPVGRSESSKLPCEEHVKHLEEKIARIKAKNDLETMLRLQMERQMNLAEEKETRVREASTITAIHVINQHLETGTMPKFAPVELTVLDVDNSWKAAVEGDERGAGEVGAGDEEEGEDAGEEQGEEVGKLSEEEQAEEAKREGVRRQWIDTLHKAAPTLVQGLPLKLNVTDPVYNRIFATKSTFFLSHGGPAGVPDTVPMLLPEEKQLLPKYGAPPRLYGSCALVGNARSLLGANNGVEIDAHDAVMRINQATTIGYEEYVGNKTTWRLVNRKWADAFRRSEQLTMTQLQEDSTLVCSRTTWRFYLAVAQAVRERRNDVYLSLLSRELVDNTGRVLRALKERVEQVRGVPYLGKASPSSGFVATYLLLQMCEKVSVYGVGDGMAGSWHYFESRDFATSREFGEDPHHSFELEHDMLQIMHSANFIQHHRTDHANATFALKAATAAQVEELRMLEAKAAAAAEKANPQSKQWSGSGSRMVHARMDADGNMFSVAMAGAGGKSGAGKQGQVQRWFGGGGGGRGGAGATESHVGGWYIMSQPKGEGRARGKGGGRKSGAAQQMFWPQQTGGGRAQGAVTRPMAVQQARRPLHH